MGLIPGSGSSHRGGNGSLLQYSSLGNPMDRGAWQAAVHRVTESARGEAQGLLEITYFAILDLVDFNQFSSYPMAMSFFLKSVSCPLLSCFINAGKIRHG